MWHSLSQEHNAQLIIIECILDENLHRKRIASRVRNMEGIPEVSWEEVETRKKEYLKWKEERLTIDTEKDNDSNLDKALVYVQSK